MILVVAGIMVYIYQSQAGKTATTTKTKTAGGLSAVLGSTDAGDIIGSLIASGGGQNQEQESG